MTDRRRLPIARPHAAAISLLILATAVTGCGPGSNTSSPCAGESCAAEGDECSPSAVSCSADGRAVLRCESTNDSASGVWRNWRQCHENAHCKNAACQFDDDAIVSVGLQVSEEAWTSPPPVIRLGTQHVAVNPEGGFQIEVPRDNCRLVTGTRPEHPRPLMSVVCVIGDNIIGIGASETVELSYESTAAAHAALSSAHWPGRPAGVGSLLSSLRRSSEMKAFGEWLYERRGEDYMDLPEFGVQLESLTAVGRTALLRRTISDDEVVPASKSARLAAPLSDSALPIGAVSYDFWGQVYVLQGTNPWCALWCDEDELPTVTQDGKQHWEVDVRLNPSIQPSMFGLFEYSLFALDSIALIGEVALDQLAPGTQLTEDGHHPLIPGSVRYRIIEPKSVHKYIDIVHEVSSQVADQLLDPQLDAALVDANASILLPKDEPTTRLIRVFNGAWTPGLGIHQFIASDPRWESVHRQARIRNLVKFGLDVAALLGVSPDEISQELSQELVALFLKNWAIYFDSGSVNWEKAKLMTRDIIEVVQDAVLAKAVDATEKAALEKLLSTAGKLTEKILNAPSKAVGGLDAFAIGTQLSAFHPMESMLLFVGTPGQDCNDDHDCAKGYSCQNDGTCAECADAPCGLGPSSDDGGQAPLQPEVAGPPNGLVNEPVALYVTHRGHPSGAQASITCSSPGSNHPPQNPWYWASPATEAQRLVAFWWSQSGDHSVRCVATTNGIDSVEATVAVSLAGAGVCPSGNGMYCGATELGQDPLVLYRCSDGIWEGVTTCATSCAKAPPHVDDTCMGTEGPLCEPFDPPQEVTCGFGCYQTGNYVHNGSDYGNATHRTPVRAPISGTAIVADDSVTGQTCSLSLGSHVAIQNGNRRVVLAHLDPDLEVSELEWVEAGTIVGYVSNTGYTLTQKNGEWVCQQGGGYHLHLELRIDGKAVDPHGPDVQWTTDCTSAPMPSCSPSDCEDDNPCTSAQCINGTCENTPLPDESPCGEDLVCVGGSCGPSVDPCADGGCSSPCDDVDCDDDNPCTQNHCNDGACSYPAETDGTPCSDGVCEGGVCGPEPCEGGSNCGDPCDGVICEAESPCMTGWCSADGQCVYEAVADETPCEGGTCDAGTCVPTQPGPQYTIDGCTGEHYDNSCVSQCEGCTWENGFVAQNTIGCSGETCFDRYPNHGYDGFVLMYTRGQQTAYVRWQFPEPLQGQYQIWADLPENPGAIPHACSSWNLASGVTYNLKSGDSTVDSKTVDHAFEESFLLFEGDLTGSDGVTLGNVGSPTNCGHILVDRVRAVPL